MNGRCRWCGLWLLPSRVRDGFPFCNRACAKASAAYHDRIPLEESA